MGVAASLEIRADELVRLALENLDDVSDRIWPADVAMLLQLDENRVAARRVERAVGGNEDIQLAVGLRRRVGRADEAESGLGAAKDAGNVISGRAWGGGSRRLANSARGRRSRIAIVDFRFEI
jgi:hypothetical protein